MSYRTGEKNLTLTSTSGDGFKKNGDGAHITKEDLQYVTDIKLVGDTYDTELSVDISGMYVYVPLITSLTFDAEGNAKIDLNKAEISGSAMYDYNTHTVTSDGTKDSYVEFVFDKTYDFTNMISGSITYTGTDLGNSLEFLSSGHGGYYGSKYNPTFADEIAKGNYKAVTGIRFHLNETAGAMTFTDFSLTASKMTLIDGKNIPIENLQNYDVAADGTVTAGSPLTTNYGTETDLFFGDGNGEMNNYVDIEGYDEMRIYSEDALRVFLFTEEPQAGTSSKKGNTHSITTSATDDYFKYNADEKYYYAKVDDIKSNNNGQAKVITVKSSGYGVKAIVNRIVVYKADPDYDYVLTGQYSSDVSLETLYSSDARSVDCTGLTGNDVTVKSQNNNCIVVAKKAGVVTGTNNIAVDGTISNLVLEDGYSLRVPPRLTATSATYTRTMTTTYGTVVLPYEVTANDKVTFFTISAMDQNSITLTETKTLTAGTPAIVKKLSPEDNITLAATDATLTPSISTSGDAVTMYGSYTQGTKVTDADAYYFYNDKFYRRAQETAEVTDPHFICNAFRAYFIPAFGAGGSAEPMSLREQIGEPTAVEATAVDALNSIQEVYNTAGVRLPELQKGVNIVRLADGKTITVTVNK